jgi:hypothetical protein
MDLVLLNTTLILDQFLPPFATLMWGKLCQSGVQDDSLLLTSCVWLQTCSRCSQIGSKLTVGSWETTSGKRKTKTCWGYINGPLFSESPLKLGCSFLTLAFFVFPYSSNCEILWPPELDGSIPFLGEIDWFQCRRLGFSHSVLFSWTPDDSALVEFLTPNGVHIPYWCWCLLDRSNAISAQKYVNLLRFEWEKCNGPNRP